MQWGRARRRARARRPARGRASRCSLAPARRRSPARRRRAPAGAAARAARGWLAQPRPPATPARRRAPGAGGYDDADLAASSEEDEAERTRLIALVELARGGDTDAFGLLYDHYQALGLPVPLLPHPLAARSPRTSPRRRSSGRCGA